MEGLEKLYALPEAQQQAINQEFGSVGELYQSVFSLREEKRRLYANRQAPDFASKQTALDNKVYDIQDRLDKIGLDGHDITTDISSDHGEIMVGRHVQALNDALKPLGTDFEKMRKWLKEQYGI